MTHQQLTERQSAKACMMGVFLLNSFHLTMEAFLLYGGDIRRKISCQKQQTVWLEQNPERIEKD